MKTLYLISFFIVSFLHLQVFYNLSSVNTTKYVKPESSAIILSLHELNKQSSKGSEIIKNIDVVKEDQKEEQTESLKEIVNEEADSYEPISTENKSNLVKNIIPKKYSKKKSNKIIKKPNKDNLDFQKPVSNQVVNASDLDDTNSSGLNSDNLDNISSGLNNGQSKINWQGELEYHWQKYKEYPIAAKRFEKKGSIRISKLYLKVDQKGTVLAVHLTQSSGNHIIDQAALNMIKRASPLPRPPEEILNNNIVDLIVSISYNLK